MSEREVKKEPGSQRSNGKAKDPKAEHSSQQSKTKSVSPQEAMITLTYGEKNNLRNWLIRLKNYLTAEFGIAASFVETKVRYVPPIPERDPYPSPPGLDASDTELEEYEKEKEILNVEYLEKRKLRVKAIEHMRLDEAKMYGIMWNYIDLNSQDKIKEAANWDTISQTQDPILLLNRIHVTVLGLKSSVCKQRKRNLQRLLKGKMKQLFNLSKGLWTPFSLTSQLEATRSLKWN
jgi:hypothetical protein